MQPNTRDFFIENIAIAIGAILLGPVVFAAAGTHLSGWLLEHHVIVPAAEHPTVALPGADGAGFDTTRLILGICGSVTGFAIGVLLILRSMRQRVTTSGTSPR